MVSLLRWFSFFHFFYNGTFSNSSLIFHFYESYFLLSLIKDKAYCPVLTQAICVPFVKKMLCVKSSTGLKPQLSKIL